MLTDKIDMMRHESCQLEMKAIVAEFRKALLKHFDVVESNSRRLINSRWGDDNA